MKLYATFACGGPLRSCYAVVLAEKETDARQWLKLHFPIDWAGIYNEVEFLPQVSKYGLREIFRHEMTHD